MDAVQVPARGSPWSAVRAGGNTHLLLASGAVSWSPVDRVGLDLGILASRWRSRLSRHPEHGCADRPGRYVLPAAGAG